MNRIANCFVVFCLALHFGVQSSRADKQERSILDPAPLPTAVASDRAEPTATDVAREVLRLQQQLGGSVVDARTRLKDIPSSSDRYVPTPRDPVPPRMRHAPDTTLLTWPEEQAMVTDRESLVAQGPRRQLPHSKVGLLRETALLLDTRAHHLEELDLYEQADALREVAARLRRDARTLKQKASTAAGGWLQPTTLPPRVAPPATK